MQTLCLGHWNAIIRILRYLNKAPGQGLLYEDKGNVQISGYCDIVSSLEEMLSLAKVRSKM